jgi:hypothetical protein
MKNLFFLFAFLCSLPLIAQQCPVDNWIRENYTLDAQLLSLKEMLSDTGSLYKDTVIISDSLVMKYVSVVSSVFDLKSVTTDSIFNLHQVHVFPDVPFNTIALKLDTNSSWVKTYLLDSLVSGNEEFDSITEKYDFRLTQIWNLSTSLIAFISSGKVLNVSALESPLKEIEGIKEALPYVFYTGDGNDIEIKSEGERSVINFSVGWGDCPSGCIDRHYWQFSVLDCQAEFIRAYGDPVTSINEITVKEGLFYPNPVSDIVYFTEASLIERVEFYSATGIPVASFNGICSPLDVSALEPGCYLIRLTTDAGIITSGLIKIQ